jgi:hypothetical protein
MKDMPRRRKVKLSLCLIQYHIMKIYGGQKVQFHTFLTSELDGSELSDSFLGFTPGK